MMGFLKKVEAGVWKGANWVKPTLQEWVTELSNEDEEIFKALKDVNALEAIYNKSYVKSFTPAQVKKIDTSDGTPPPLEWLENPKADTRQWNINQCDYGVRFLRRHHKDVIPAMKEGKPLTMPILQHHTGKFTAQAGRHRIVYCVTLGLPLKAFVTDWGDILAVVGPNAFKR